MFGFNIQDFFGSVLGVLLFPLVSLIPGYAVGWAFDFFEFRKRSRPARYVLAIVLSNAVFPIVAYLGYRYLTVYFLIGLFVVSTGVFAVVELAPLVNHRRQALPSIFADFPNTKKYSFVLAGAWILASLFLLVDLQFGNRLYFANVAIDSTTRIAIINAITRTGIPPINPGYFPGHPVALTFLYYYWYIPPSIIDLIGGNLVNSRQAMIAGTIWSGLCWMSTIGLYLRLRNPPGRNNWIAPLIGIQLLLVSGLDFIPVVAIDLEARAMLGLMAFRGTVEGWNITIMSWLNAITRVPNHVSATGQCITAMLAILVVLKGTDKHRGKYTVLAGMALASAFGSSVWVTVVFAVAWIIWALVLFLFKHLRGVTWQMLLSGLLGLGLSIPFGLGLEHGGGGSVSNILPLAFLVRPFPLITNFVAPNLQALESLILLPVNYLMELGLFLVLGAYWLRHRREYQKTNQHFLPAEMILLGVVFLMLTFLTSTVSQDNDLGVRGWLLGQFVLLVWATDVIQVWLERRPPSLRAIFQSVGRRPQIGKALLALLVIGILTTALEAFSTRLWSVLVDWDVTGFPNELSPDTNLGLRTYAAKTAYEFINSQLPVRAVIQYNPYVSLDRPSGLYGERQTAISDRTAYGVPETTFKLMQQDVGTIFRLDTRWNEIDQKCEQYSINDLVINDLDPLWMHLPVLELQRKPLYENQFYSVIACGRPPQP